MKGLLINKALPSTVALACGKRKNGLINTIGTGFCVGTSVKNENTMLLATCTHVFDELDRIRSLKKEEGVIEGFIDNLPRIALLENGSWSWKEIKPEKYDVTALYEQGQKINITNMDDACIIEIPGIKIPSIPIFKGKNIPGFKGNPDKCVAYELGSEVMIIGFPVFVDLQTNYIAPYILKTIISCTTLVLFERDSKKTPSPRLALGCIVGNGFSGSPVISIKNGSVVGMIDYTPYETELMDLKINKPRPIEGNVDLRYPAGVTFAIPSIVIKHSLNLINQNRSLIAVEPNVSFGNGLKR